VSTSPSWSATSALGSPAMARAISTPRCSPSASCPPMLRYRAAFHWFRLAELEAQCITTMPDRALSQHRRARALGEHRGVEIARAMAGEPSAEVALHDGDVLTIGQLRAGMTLARLSPCRAKLCILATTASAKGRG